MKRLRSFAYYEPTTLGEAIDALAKEGEDAHVLAGGTDLIVDMKIERLRPSAVVNLKGIPGLAGIDALVQPAVETVENTAWRHFSGAELHPVIRRYAGRVKYIQIRSPMVS